MMNFIFYLLQLTIKLDCGALDSESVFKSTKLTCKLSGKSPLLPKVLFNL